MKRKLSFIAGCLILPILLVAQRIDSSVQTILFLGNSITYAGDYITDIEACYTVSHPLTNIKFINLGLPSETVSGLSEPGHAGGKFPRPDLHERLHRILKAIQPDIVFTSYGMNDGIYQPFNEDRFQQFKNGMKWLHDTLAATGARVVVLTPPVYDELRGGVIGYAAVLDKYTDWLLSCKKSANWEVIDIHSPMIKYIRAHRAADKKLGIDGFALAADGVHPGEAGHWLMAKEILRHLKEKQVANCGDIQTVMRKRKNGIAVLALVTERQHVMKDAWLSAIGHNRPGMKAGLPLDEASIQSAAIKKKINDLLK
ncbi:MAG: SGNH/GDSL hydrolase family protein [Chitinophagaceae bacterium]